MPLPADIAAARYINLETFKKSGDGVLTPVWLAVLGDSLVVVTGSDSWKVKRLRRNPRVRVAACDVRGKLKGEWVDGSCEILSDPEREEQARVALRTTYGWQMALADLGSGLRGRLRGDDNRTFLEIRLDS